MKYAIIENNKVVNIIKCDQKFIKENNIEAIEISNQNCSIGFDFINGKFVNPNPEIKEQKTYIELRQDAYGSYAEQLDMIYHKGLTAWKSHIKKVKEQFPKE